MPDAARANDPGPQIRAAVERVAPHLIAIRRDIHAHPELAFEEVRTAGQVAAELSRLGVPYQSGVGRTGVVALIEGARPGPVLAIRADMDALPIREKTGLPFASEVSGRMHACGHDVHTSTLLGVANVLKELAPQLAGSVKLIFQPAEEALGGAAAMLADGVLDAPKVDFALAFHNHPDMPVGQFGYCRGACLAASDRFDITVSGRSGHAAYPHTAIDPIVAAAFLITQLQTVVSREIDPVQPAVVTVGAISGGEANNIIPDAVTFCGTVRTLQADARRTAEAAIRRFCEGSAATLRVECALTYTNGVPALVNDDGVLERTVAAVRAQFGDVIEGGKPSLGGEDFALIAERVPAFQLRIGSSQPGRNDKLHNSAYQPDEACIGLGVQALARAAVEFLG